MSVDNTLVSGPKMKSQRQLKSIVLLSGYVIIIVVIVIGFIVGNDYNAFDTRHPSVFLHGTYWESVYDWETIDEQFDGVIDRYKGWYGLSWEHTYSFYQDTDLSREDFESYCKIHKTPDDYTSWKESQYVEYVTNYKSLDTKYTWIVINDKIVLVEFAPTNNVVNYEKILPKVIVICIGMLLLPVAGLLIIKIVDTIKLLKSVDMLN